MAIYFRLWESFEIKDDSVQSGSLSHRVKEETANSSREGALDKQKGG